MSVVTSNGNYLNRIGDVIHTNNIFSAVIWFSRNSDSGADEIGLEFVENASAESYTSAYVNTNDRLQLYGGGAGLSAEFGANPISVGEWYYLLITKNATPTFTVKELSDGDSAFGDSATLETGLDQLNVDELYVGRGGVAQPAPWTIAFIKIWTGIVLSDADALLERYYRLPQTNISDLWAVYTFRDGALGADSIGNFRPLTVQGTPTFSSNQPATILGDHPIEIQIPSQTDWEYEGVRKIVPGEFNVDWDGFIHPPWSVVNSGSTRYLYFGAALNDSGPDFRSIGVATSLDGGISWDKYSSNPVITFNPSGPTSPEEGATSAVVILDNGIFHCWYGANTDVGGDSIDMSIRYASSSDGYTFGGHTTVLETSGWEYWPQAVIKIDSTYYLYMTIIDGPPTGAGGRGPLELISGSNPATLGGLTLVESGSWTSARIVDYNDDYFLMDLSVNNVLGVWNWYCFDKTSPTTIIGPYSGKQTQLYELGSRVYNYNEILNEWQMYHHRAWSDEYYSLDGIYQHHAFVPVKGSTNISGLFVSSSDNTLKLFGNPSPLNKALSISGSGDLKFLLSGSGATFTLPNSSTTLLGSDTTQSFTNKSGSFIQIQIPSSGSAPTFTPTQDTDQVTLFYNTGSNFLYVYSRGSWVSKSFV